MSTPLQPDPATFSWPLRVYWEDTDAGGIVFYANYLKFFERARTEWLRSLGVQQSLLRQTSGGIFVVAQANLSYHKSAKLDDELLVTAARTETGRVSMTIQQQAWLKTTGSPVLLCEGSIRIGWVDANNQKPMRIPGTLLEILK
jgi:acyl-CoA thioester hydrolase